MKNRTLFKYLIPAWLLGILFAPNLTPEVSSTVQAIAVLWITGVGLLLGGPRFLLPSLYRESLIIPVAMGVFLLIILPGCFFSLSPSTSLGLWATALASFITCAGLWVFINQRDFINSLKIYALIGLTLLALIISLSDYRLDIQTLLARESRLDILRNPNGLGMILMGLLLCALTIENLKARILLMLIGLFILFLTLSRSAIIGTTLAFGLFAFFRWKEFKPFERGLIVTVGSLFILLIVAFYGERILAALDILTAFSDPQSGWGKFTFRMEAWQETIALWGKYPLLGVGYRMHEPYITSLSSAHNGYLALLAETGILGAIPMAIFLIAGLGRIFKAAWCGSRFAQIGFALICGVLFTSFFERTLINFGNPTSILQLMMLLMPWSAAAPRPGVSPAQTV